MVDSVQIPASSSLLFKSLVFRMNPTVANGYSKQGISGTGININQGISHVGIRICATDHRGVPASSDVSVLVGEVKIMQTSRKFHIENFKRLFYEGSVLLFYILGLVMAVALAAHGLEILSSSL